MTFDYETALNMVMLLNSVSTEDKKYSINLMTKRIDKKYMVDWVNKQDAKLLTLDGSYGGRSGKDFDYLSTDLTAQDDWHIGRQNKYDMQGWFRYPVVIYKFGMNFVGIRKAEEKELHNAYIVVSKKDIRGKSKNLKRAKTEELKDIANKMVDKYIESFNAIGRNEVYYLTFSREINDTIETQICSDFYGSIIDTEEVKRNMRFNDKEFDILIERVLTFDE